MPHVTGIHHVAVTVSALAASAAFYERVLGLPPAGGIDDEHLHRRLFTLPDGVSPGDGCPEADMSATGPCVG